MQSFSLLAFNLWICIARGIAHNQRSVSTNRLKILTFLIDMAHCTSVIFMHCGLTLSFAHPHHTMKNRTN